MKYIYKHIKYFILGLIFLVLVSFATFGPTSYNLDIKQANEPAPDFTGTFSVITYDTSLLDLRMLGTSIYRSSDYIEQRAKNIPKELLKFDADVIALQKVYSKKHIDYFISKLKDLYPYYFFKHNSSLRINNGLLLFSKYPFLSTSVESQIAKASFDEMLITDSGVLSAVIRLNDQIKLDIVNMHATPGGLLLKSGNDAIEVREEQLKQALNLAIASGEPKQIILGDINAGPNTFNENYFYLIEQGFIDAYHEYSVKSNTKIQPSWTGNNPLNIQKGADPSLEQRIDHIFLSKALTDEININKVSRILDEPILTIGKKKIPLSDHYGILIEIEFSNY